MEPDRNDVWQLAFEHSPVGTTLIDLTGRLRVVNRALCDMLGHSAEELVAKGFAEVTHPDDLDVAREMFGKVSTGEVDSYRDRRRYLHADGHIVFGELSVALVRDDDGAPMQMIAQVLDVTELERERRTLEAIFETVDVGLLLIDDEGQYARMNRRHAESMLMPFPDGHAGLAGQLGDVFAPDGTPMRREDMPSYRAWHGEEFDDLRLWVGSDPGGRSAWSVSARSVREDGELTGAALAYKNITDLMRALQVKDDFVASVSHELRTPLTSVLGHLEMLTERPDVPPDIARQLTVVERNAVRLQTLVHDLLDVARARQGMLTLTLDPLDIAMLAQDAVAAARPAADARAITLTCEVPDALPFQADGHRLRQVVDNLLANAIKYTRHEGSVTVTARTAEADSIEIVVADTGIGIGEADQSHVFDRFYRAGDVEAQHIPGTGLGLSIVRDIVEAHEGTLTVSSALGEGSEFTVRLPRRHPTAQ